MSKVHGVEYINWSGKQVARRETGPNCRCPKKCFEHFTVTEMNDFVDKMNAFKNKDQQDLFLQQQIEKADKKSSRPRKEVPKARSCNFRFGRRQDLYYLRRTRHQTQAYFTTLRCCEKKCVCRTYYAPAQS
ncbi:uncharacterized protein LOC106668794 [Cimex lectularius]|uniref:Uncharacterized protein n=1 Tax=Cimex lectularius TaxID=79782 RepID=A0A8I6S032_CIMLE|nr:uncharacterized protein LOC106668794 [Cimex lectularius]